MASELVRQLVDSGIHFGHRASRWNPKMAPFIFGKRNTIHIIDVRETVKGLLRAKKFIAQVVARGEGVLFVGTKRQARMQIKQQANRVGMPYVAERWLGGTLTNFRTIRLRLARLEELEAAEADGSAAEYSKKMMASRAREMRKIKRNLQGIREMTKLPGAVVVIDVHRERNAVREAKKLSIPTVCLIDTDSDPDYADVPIPGNDDAIRAIELILGYLGDAVEEGKRGRITPLPSSGGPTRPGRPPRRPVPARIEEGALETVAAAGAETGGETATEAGAEVAPPAGEQAETPIQADPGGSVDSSLTPATTLERESPS